MDVNSLESWLLNYVQENYPTFKSFHQYHKGLTRLKFILELDDEKIIFRIFRKHDHIYFQNEKKALEGLIYSKNKPLDFPKIFNIIDSNELKVLIVSFIEGKALDFQLDKGIEVWKAWNSLDTPKIEINTHKKATRDWMRILNEGINQNPELFENDKNQYLSLIKKFLIYWPREEQSRLIHGDFHLENIIVNNTEYGLIDWEYSSIGDPLFDLAYLIIYYFGEKVEIEEDIVVENLRTYIKSLTQELSIDIKLFLEWGTLASFIISLWFLDEFIKTEDKVFLVQSLKYVHIAKSMGAS